MHVVEFNTPPYAILHDARHILFIEGENRENFDSKVLGELFDDQPTKLRIEALGASFHVKSAAQAMVKHHPHYYFLIDRDHFQDHEVDASWNNFPNPNTHNLLIWRKREIENYFLNPDYLSQSEYLKAKVTPDTLKETIRQAAQTRLYLDVANQVIVSIREECKEKWIDVFRDPTMFKTPDAALTQLTDKAEFTHHLQKTSDLCNNLKIQERFHEYLNHMTGGKDKLEYESGRWLDLIQGKAVLSQIINQCFDVHDVNGQVRGGSEKITDIAKKLLQKKDHLPQDFIDLKRLICQRIAQN